MQLRSNFTPEPMNQYQQQQPFRNPYLNNDFELESNSQFEDEDDSPGVALKAVKEKWTQLGPLKLEDIIANSAEPIDQAL